MDKTGAATLTLSGANTYSGGTTLDAGTLTMGNASALGTGILAMAAGTTLDFLGSYTVNNAVTVSGDPTFNVNTGLTTTWTGSISDGTAPGVLDKIGAGALTLSGVNTYTGGTTLDAGTLAITNGQAVGTGVVTDNATFNLAFATSDTLANQILGSGTLQNTGAGTATLTGAGSSVGAVDVQAGTLALAQNGVFTAGAYTTQTGASTAIGGTSQLAVSGALTQAAG
ncbi:autotransporter-associated beta strand repeat-containing protein, partial [Paraburkholderia rhynchosiae]